MDDGNRSHGSTTVNEAITSDEYPIEHGNMTREDAKRHMEELKMTPEWQMVSRFAINHYPQGFPEHIDVNEVFRELQRHSGPPAQTLEDHALWQGFLEVNTIAPMYPEFEDVDNAGHWVDYLEATYDGRIPVAVSPELAIALMVLNFEFKGQSCLPEPYHDFLDSWGLGWIVRPLSEGTRPTFWQRAKIELPEWRSNNLLMDDWPPAPDDGRLPLKLDQYFGAGGLLNRTRCATSLHIETATMASVAHNPPPSVPFPPLSLETMQQAQLQREADVMSKLETARKELEQKTQECRTKDDSITQLRERVASLEQQFEQASHQIAERDQKINEKDQRINEKDQKINEMSLELKEMDRRNFDKGQTIANKTQRIIELDQELEKMYRKTANKGQKIAEKTRKIYEMDRQLEEMNRKNVEKDQKIAEKTRKVKQLESQSPRLEKNLKNILKTNETGVRYHNDILYHSGRLMECFANAASSSIKVSRSLKALIKRTYNSNAQHAEGPKVPVGDHDDDTAGSEDDRGYEDEDDQGYEDEDDQGYENENDNPDPRHTERPEVLMGNHNGCPAGGDSDFGNALLPKKRKAQMMQNSRDDSEDEDIINHPNAKKRTYTLMLFQGHGSRRL